MTASRVLCAAVLAVAAISSCAREERESGLDIVRITTHGRLSSSALFIAEEEGFFADERIKLRFVEAPRSSVQAIPLLERGDIDVLGASASSGFYAALARGARSRIVADRGHVAPGGCDFNGVMGRRDSFASDSPTAAELKGKKFSINKAGTAEFVSHKYFESMGLSLSDIEIVQLNETVESQALEGGSIDGMHVAEPFLTPLRSRGHRLLAPGWRLSPGSHFSLVLFGPSLLVRNRDLGQRFINAYLRGTRQFAEGATPRNVEIIAGRTGYDPDVLRRACLPLISPDGEVSIPWLIEFQKWAVAQGYLDGITGPDAGTDLSFSRRAAAQARAESSAK